MVRVQVVHNRVVVTDDCWEHALECSQNERQREASPHQARLRKAFSCQLNTFVFFLVGCPTNYKYIFLKACFDVQTGCLAVNQLQAIWLHSFSYRKRLTRQHHHLDKQGLISEIGFLTRYRKLWSDFFFFFLTSRKLRTFLVSKYYNCFPCFQRKTSWKHIFVYPSWACHRTRMCLPPSNHTVNSKVRAVQLPSDRSRVEVCLCSWPFRALQLRRSADCTEREANSRWRHGLTITASSATTYKNPQNQTCVRSGVFLFEK